MKLHVLALLAFFSLPQSFLSAQEDLLEDASPDSVPTNTVFPRNGKDTLRIRFKGSLEDQKIDLNWKGGKKKTLTIAPFHTKFWVGNDHPEFEFAGIEVKELDLHMYVRPDIALFKHSLQKEMREQWKTYPTATGKDFTFEIRKEKNGVSFWLNGQYGGETGDNETLASAVLPADMKAEFLSSGGTERHLTLDLTALNRPGIMKDSKLRFENTTGIPFRTADGVNLDAGVTVSHPSLYNQTYTDAGYTARNGYDNAQDSYLWVIPAAPYTRAWVLCAAEEAADGKTPVLTARMTRFATAFQGRSREALADHSLTVTPESAKQVGEVIADGKTYPLYLAEFVIPFGKIMDFVTDPILNPVRKWYEYSLHFGRYLDFEITGKLNGFRHPFEDKSMMPDSRLRSSIHVFGITLERCGTDFALTQTRPGNVFANDEKPEIKLNLKKRFPGEYHVKWTIRDESGKTVKEGDIAQTRDVQEETLDLNMGRNGWFRLDFTLLDGKRELYTHNAAFALLGKDTRKAGYDSYYGAWMTNGEHITCPDFEINADLMYKAGVRRCYGLDARRGSEEQYKKWGFTYPFLYISNEPKKDDETVRKTIEDMKMRYPHCDVVMTFWEGMGGYGYTCYEQAPELWGGKQEKTPWPPAKSRFDCAMQIGRVVRKHFPGVKIMMGNSMVSSELLAAVFRQGLPKEYVDYVGSEAIARTAHPEKPNTDIALSGMENMINTAKIFGYGHVRPSCCVESVQRQGDLLGEQRQAEWYVRDLLFMHAWKFSRIYINGIGYKCGNSYAGSFYGGGTMKRYPLLYPEIGYAALATATKVLDRVTPVKLIPTGSGSVYALEFDSRDGKKIYAVWCSRGDAELTLNGDFTNGIKVGFTGNEERLNGKDTLTLTAGTAACYLILEHPVSSISTGKRTYRNDMNPDDFQIVEHASDPEKWEVRNTPEPLLELLPKNESDSRWFRKFAGAVFRSVEDPEKGKCLELTLNSKENQPEIIHDYAVLKLKQPIPLSGKPHTVGAWVKGNSGWGQFYWMLEDASGRRLVSCGCKNYGDVFDYDGRVSIDFDGWNFLSMPITADSPIPDLSTGCVANLWEPLIPEGVRYPVKLTGVAFSASSRPLFLNERKPWKQTICIRDISVMEGKK